MNPSAQSQSPSSSTSSATVDVKIITPAPAVAPTQVPPSGSSSVADLLAQLKNPIPDGAQTIPLHASSIESLDAPQRTSSAPSLDLDEADIFLRETLPPRKQRKDLRSLSLQQSLPILAELSKRRDCVDCIVKVSERCMRYVRTISISLFSYVRIRTNLKKNFGKNESGS